MLKTAYQVGVQIAFNEINVNQLVKEAQELGINLTKSAGALGNFPGVAERALERAMSEGGLLGGLRHAASRGGLKGVALAGKAVGRSAKETGRAALGGLRRGAGAVGQTLSEAGGAMGREWANLSPRQQALILAGLGTAGAGGAGLGAASYFGGEEE